MGIEKLLVFDVESNGLHGEGFAVGGVVTALAGGATSEIAVRTSVVGPVDPWVAEHVLPVLDQRTDWLWVATPRDLRTFVWCWLRQHMGPGTLVAVDVGWPVEARFLADCVADDPGVRVMEGPYPLYEVSTLIAAAAGVTQADVDRERYARGGLFLDQGVPPLAGHPHDPVYDAHVSSRCFLRAAATVEMLHP